MAAGFLIIRILLVCLLSKVKHSLAFPRGESFLHPKSWQGGGGEPQELLGYGNRRPFQSVQSLRVSPRSWQPSVPHYEVNPRGPNPLRRFLGAIRNIPSVVGSRWQQAMSLPLRTFQSMQPRTLDINLRVPFKGAGARYRPARFQVQTAFNKPDEKGSLKATKPKEYNPNKPSVNFGFDVPFSN